MSRLGKETMINHIQLIIIIIIIIVIVIGFDKTKTAKNML
jgi:hypothetical protein